MQYKWDEAAGEKGLQQAIAFIFQASTSDS